MTDRIWFAPADTPIEDAIEWQEVGTVTDFQFTTDDDARDDERAWGFPAGATFTASFAAPGLFDFARAAIKAAEHREREIVQQRALHLEAQRITDHRLRSVFELHPLGGGRWRYGETGTLHRHNTSVWLDTTTQSTYEARARRHPDHIEVARVTRPPSAGEQWIEGFLEGLATPYQTRRDRRRRGRGGP